jgi:hypothetical protein
MYGLMAPTPYPKKNGKMMGLPGFPGFQNQAHFHAGSFADHIVMKPRHRQEGGNRGFLFPDAAVR